MKHLNFRWRLTLWYGSVLAVLVAGFGCAVYALMAHHLVAHSEFDLNEELSELTVEVQIAKSNSELLSQLQKRFYHHEGFEFQVSDSKGEKLFSSENLEDMPAAASEALAAPAHHVSSQIQLPGLGDYRILGRTIDGPEGSLVIQAMVPLAQDQATRMALLQMLLAAGPLVIAGGLGGGYWLARATLRPVNRMTQNAEEITAARLDQRIEVPDADDELSQLARTFNRLIDRLERSFEQMRRFTADAAHELRTPLSVLRTEVEVAMRSSRTSEEYQQALKIVLSECGRLSRLTEQLLALCRHDGRLPSRAEEVQLDALIRDVADRLRGPAEAKGLTLSVQELEEAVVLGDDTQLSQLFFNVLENAIKFTPAGGHIDLVGKCRGGRAIIEISDTGLGIATEHLPHVFERFYRVDAARDQHVGGTGLGLAICKAIVESCHGDITMRSRHGQGTTVIIELPIHAPQLITAAR